MDVGTRPRTRNIPAADNVISTASRPGKTATALATEAHPYHNHMVCGALALHLPLLWLVDPMDVVAVAAALSLFINTYVRIAYPSCYVPATQAAPGILHHPLFARCLATIAELIFYDAQARGFNMDAWGHSVAVGMCLFGECVCWSHLIFQSEAIAIFEDCTWFSIQLFFLLFSPSQLRWPVCLPFVVYMFTHHLPRMMKRVEYPYISLYKGTTIAARDADTVAWTVPTLYVMSGGYSLFLYMAALRMGGEELVLW